MMRVDKDMLAMRQDMNIMRVDMSLIKSMWSDTMFQKINQNQDHVKQLIHDFEVVKITQENTVLKSEFQKVLYKLDNLVSQDKLDDFINQYETMDYVSAS